MLNMIKLSDTCFVVTSPDWLVYGTLEQVVSWLYLEAQLDEEEIVKLYPGVEESAIWSSLTQLL